MDSFGFEEVPEFLENIYERPGLLHEAAFRIEDQRRAQICQEAKEYQNKTGAFISFYAAECDEFHEMGEYYSNLPLQEAAKHYREMQAGIDELKETGGDAEIVDMMDRMVTELKGCSNREYFMVREEILVDREDAEFLEE